MSATWPIDGRSWHNMGSSGHCSVSASRWYQAQVAPTTHMTNRWPKRTLNGMKLEDLSQVCTNRGIQCMGGICFPTCLQQNVHMATGWFGHRGGRPWFTRSTTEPITLAPMLTRATKRSSRSDQSVFKKATTSLRHQQYASASILSFVHVLTYGRTLYPFIIAVRTPPHPHPKEPLGVDNPGLATLQTNQHEGRLRCSIFLSKETERLAKWTLKKGPPPVSSKQFCP